MSRVLSVCLLHAGQLSQEEIKASVHKEKAECEPSTAPVQCSNREGVPGIADPVATATGGSAVLLLALVLNLQDFRSLEVFKWDGIQSLHSGSLDIIHTTKMVSFHTILHLWEDEQVAKGQLCHDQCSGTTDSPSWLMGYICMNRLIHQLRPYLENDCLATVTHALVTSRLDFCNALYVGLPLKTVRILQLVQNRAARLLTGTGRYGHMTPVLRQLHWLPIEVRAQFKVLVMTYKALNGLGPGYLKERLRPYMPSHPLRSAGEALLREPSGKEIRRVATRRRAFSAVAPNLWNTLPREVRLAPSLFAFRRQAKTFLFKRMLLDPTLLFSGITECCSIIDAGVKRNGVSNSQPAGQLPGRALRPSKRRRHPGWPRDERSTTTAVVEYLMRPSLTQTLLPAAPSINMKLLSGVIQRFEVCCHQYADDTQLYAFFIRGSSPQKDATTEQALLLLDVNFTSHKEVSQKPVNFSLFNSSGWGIDLDYCDVEWFALDSKKHFLHQQVIYERLLPKNLSVLRNILIPMWGFHMQFLLGIDQVGAVYEMQLPNDLDWFFENTGGKKAQSSLARLPPTAILPVPFPESARTEDKTAKKRCGAPLSFQKAKEKNKLAQRAADSLRATARWARRWHRHERQTPSARTMFHDASSVCEHEIRRDYEKILTPSISKILMLLGDTTGQNAAPSRLNNTTVVTCSSDKERSIYCMAQCLKKLSNQTIPHELKNSMDIVSEQTLETLKKNCNSTNTQNGRCTRQNRCKKNICIKKIVDGLKSCWIQFIT
ncbi:Tryptophan synthase alpha chain [Varanus komodoensis]|nr:Tryptophan synthase alpha chain [Varanus komodoensis]